MFENLRPQQHPQPPDATMPNLKQAKQNYQVGAVTLDLSYTLDWLSPARLLTSLP